MAAHTCTHVGPYAPKICTQNPDVNSLHAYKNMHLSLKHIPVCTETIWQVGPALAGLHNQPCDVVMEYSVLSVMFPMTIHKLENITDENEHLANFVCFQNHKNNKMMIGWDTFVDMLLSLHVIFPVEVLIRK